MSTSETTAGAQHGPLPPWQRALSWILLVLLIGMIVDGLVIGQLQSRLGGGHDAAMERLSSAGDLLNLCLTVLYVLLGLASLTGYILLTIRRRSGAPASPVD